MKLTLAETTIALNNKMSMLWLSSNYGDISAVNVNDGVGDVNGAGASM